MQRSATIQVRVTKEEKQMLEAIASEDCESLSEAVRNLIRQERTEREAEKERLRVEREAEKERLSSCRQSKGEQRGPEIRKIQ